MNSGNTGDQGLFRIKYIFRSLVKLCLLITNPAISNYTVYKPCSTTHTHTQSLNFFVFFNIHISVQFYLGFHLNMQKCCTQGLKAHFKHLKRKKMLMFSLMSFYFPLCCWSGSGVRYDCNVVETEAAVKAPVIGCRLHRDQQMEGRGAACILKV